MFVKVYDNYHAGASLLSDAEQDAFYGAIMRYAFDGAEPELDGGAAVLWAAIKRFIDESLRGQENGAKGGNGRGNANPPKPPCKTPSENPPAKPPTKRWAENQKKRKEGNSKENLEGFFTNSQASGDAAAAGAAPPAECPKCGSGMIGTGSHRNGKRLFLCPDCAEEVWL